MDVHKWRYSRFFLMGSLIAGIVLSGGLYFRFKSNDCNGIAVYDAARDRDFILKLFKDNWYWLIPENSDFSPEYFLDNRAPTEAPTDRGKSNIAVYCNN